MEHREKILSDVQDSVFFLLLDELSDYQGKTYQKINKDLQSEPTTAIPSEVTAACRQTIRKTFQTINRKRRRKKAASLFKKITFAVAIIILLIAGAFSAFPTFRANTMNWVVDIMDDRTQLFLDSTPDWNTQWLPENYTSISVSDDRNLYMFKDPNAPDENWIVMTVVARDGSRISVDTEDADLVEELEVRGFQSLFIEKDGFTTLVWNYTDTDYVITLMASALTKAEICKIAENIYPA